VQLRVKSCRPLPAARSFQHHLKQVKIHDGRHPADEASTTTTGPGEGALSAATPPPMDFQDHAGEDDRIRPSGTSTTAPRAKATTWRPVAARTPLVKPARSKDAQAMLVEGQRPRQGRRTESRWPAQKAAMVITSPIRTRPDGAVAPSETAVKTET